MPNCLGRAYGGLIGCLIAISILELPAQVVPDGTTATTIVPGTGGRIRVQIAPVNSSRTSLNRYSDFNVSAAGLEFNNLSRGARTIVTQVTGSKITRLQGGVEVLGTRANLIFANPNGIYVNGARFLNTGGLALTTGEISSRSYPVVPGFAQENVVVSTARGKVVIEQGGLRGAFAYLEVLAKEIEIHGLLENESCQPLSHVRMTAGVSEAEFDSLQVPGNSAQPWTTIQAGTASAEGQTLVTITRNGSVSANHIAIAVTDRGAGVRLAGETLARAGDFDLTATGEVVLSGGKITAANQVRIQPPLGGNGLRLKAEPLEGRKFEISGEDGVFILGDEAKFDRGNVRSIAGPVEVVMGPGGVENRGAVFEGTQREGIGIRLETTGKFVNRSLSAEDLAILSANEGDLVIRTGGNLENLSGRLLAAENIDLDVRAKLVNRTLTTGDFGAEERKSDRRVLRWYKPWNRAWNKVSADYGNWEIPGELAYITAGKRLRVDSLSFYNLGGEVNANGGNLRIQTGLLHNEALRIGRYSYESSRRWWLFRKSSGFSNVQVLGGNLSAAGDLDAQANDGIYLKGGRLWALGDVSLRGPFFRGDVIRTYQNYSGPQGIREWWNGRRQKLMVTGLGAEVISTAGSIQLNFDRNIELKSGRFEAPKGIEGSGWRKVPAPQATQPFGDGHFGFIGDWVD